MTQIKKAPYIAAMALGPIFIASCNVEIAPQNDNIMSPQIERGAEGVSLTYNAPFDDFIIDNSNSFPIASDQTNNYALIADKDVIEIIFTDGVYKDDAFQSNTPPRPRLDVDFTVTLIDEKGLFSRPSNTAPFPDLNKNNITASWDYPAKDWGWNDENGEACHNPLFSPVFAIILDYSIEGGSTPDSITKLRSDDGTTCVIKEPGNPPCESHLYCEVQFTLDLDNFIGPEEGATPPSPDEPAPS